MGEVARLVEALAWQTWWPEFEPWNPHKGRKREPTPQLPIDFHRLGICPVCFLTHTLRENGLTRVSGFMATSANASQNQSGVSLSLPPLLATTLPFRLSCYHCSGLPHHRRHFSAIVFNLLKTWLSDSLHRDGISHQGRDHVSHFL